MARWRLKNKDKVSLYNKKWNSLHFHEYFEKNKLRVRKLRQASKKRLRKLYPEKWKARDKVYREVKKGNLIKLPCEVCSDKKAQAHHEDYSKPLDIKWLCFKHHFQLHKNKLSKNLYK